MNKKIVSVLAGVVFAVAASPSFADQFLLHNDTHHAITNFTTKEKGEKWSSNWIKKRIKPGETWTMEFAKPGKNCVVAVNVKSDDGYVHDYDVNFCKASEIFILDDSIEYK